MADGGTCMESSREQATPPVDWEAALVRQAGRGDVLAFERLYREHAGRVHGLCLRLVRESMAAEDCTQETFIRAWRSLARFEARSAFATWLHRIAVNVVLERRRGPAEREALAAASLSDSDGAACADRAVLDTPVEEREIEAAVASLPEGAHDALVLCGIYGYTHQQAGEMLGVAEGTCKAQLHRARALLRERLERGGS
jgi:RNA polymerase sigma-70 factor (ECF subfamily)